MEPSQHKRTRRVAAGIHLLWVVCIVPIVTMTLVLGTNLVL